MVINCTGQRKVAAVIWAVDAGGGGEVKKCEKQKGEVPDFFLHDCKRRGAIHLYNEKNLGGAINPNQLDFVRSLNLRKKMDIEKAVNQGVEWFSALFFRQRR